MEIEKISQWFHEATNLSIFLYDDSNHLSKVFKMTVAPNLSEQLSNKILKNINSKININLFAQIGTIASFKLEETKILIWATSTAISGNGAYADKVPLTDFNTFQAQLKIFYFALTKSEPTFTQQQLDLNDYGLLDRPNQRLESFSDNKPSHNGYLAEQLMLMGVEHGNLKEFNKNYIAFMDKGNFGILASSDLRSKKNITVAATTLFTRAAIRGGMYAESAYELSDECIKKTETKQNITNIYEYTRTIGERFVKNVALVKRNNIPSLVYRAQEYIYDNLTIVKNVDEIAQFVGSSKSYLMHLFKKTTGISIIEFLTSQKILSAKQLLLFTQLPIREISDTLGYENPSQLSRVFKSKTGQTPSQFRKNQNL
ncbi:helix-turn-helix domain-containing protein [Companilactobacillus formosensis]|uniref:helix-turn-helix domain-containing protein n=1 Tax=Companilactobacillus formosensis TaxID=1617889 RepID=UPI000E64E83B|nr:AraC family transcriptional regulator [Companilactobacillus formosensis]